MLNVCLYNSRFKSFFLTLTRANNFFILINKISNCVFNFVVKSKVYSKKPQNLQIDCILQKKNFNNYVLQIRNGTIDSENTSRTHRTTS